MSSPRVQVAGQTFGAYDGVDVWTLRSWTLRTTHERVFASLHERLHHELQSSTLWGLLTRFTDDYSASPDYRSSARLLFWVGVMRSQMVHETFATTLAAGMDPEYVALLDNNPGYRARYETGVGLLQSSPETWPKDRLVVDAVLRACMLAPALVTLIQELPSIRVAELDTPANRPDARMLKLIELDLRPLRQEVPELPLTISQLDAFHDRCARYLTARGLPTPEMAEVSPAVEAMVERARELLGLDITIDTERTDAVADDAQAAQRERIELHEAPLPARVTTLAEAAAHPELFVRAHPSLGNHVLIVWVRQDVLARQLEGLPALDQNPVLALQAADAGTDGVAVTRLAICTETDDPSELAAAFTSVETLILTTLSTLLDAPATARFAGQQDLYVLVDTPVVEALTLAFERGAPVTWARLEVNGDQQLKGLIWEAAGLPGVLHLYLAADASHLALVRWLALQPEQLATADQNLMRSRQMHLDALVQHLFAAWHVLERRDRANA